jgi:hypothetical protein
MPDPLVAEFVDDETSIDKKKASTVAERRAALEWCLKEIWAGVDVDTLERVDDAKADLHGWAMWERA